MARVVTAATIMALAFAGGCGSGVDVSVSWTAPTTTGLDPFASDVGVRLVRVSLEAEGVGDSAFIDVMPSERSAKFSGVTPEQRVIVRVEALGGSGNVLAFGESESVSLDGSVELAIAVRRNFAYITHKPTSRGSQAGDLGRPCTADTDCMAPTCAPGEDCPPATCLTGPLGSFCGGACSDCPNGFACGVNPEMASDTILRCQKISQPERYIYLLDVGTRTIAGKLELPGTRPAGLRVSARGGESMLIPYTDNGVGFLAVLSTNDNSISSFELSRPYQIALADAASPIAVLAGGGAVALYNIDSGTQIAGPFDAGRRRHCGWRHFFGRGVRHRRVGAVGHSCRRGGAADPEFGSCRPTRRRLHSIPTGGRRS